MTGGRSKRRLSRRTSGWWPRRGPRRNLSEAQWRRPRRRPGGGSRSRTKCLGWLTSWTAHTEGCGALSRGNLRSDSKGPVDWWGWMLVVSRTRSWFHGRSGGGCAPYCFGKTLQLLCLLQCLQLLLVQESFIIRNSFMSAEWLHTGGPDRGRGMDVIQFNGSSSTCLQCFPW